MIPGRSLLLLEEQGSKVKVVQRTSVVFQLKVEDAILFSSPAPLSTLGVLFSLSSSPRPSSQVAGSDVVGVDSGASQDPAGL